MLQTLVEFTVPNMVHQAITGAIPDHIAKNGPWATFGCAPTHQSLQKINIEHKQ